MSDTTQDVEQWNPNEDDTLIVPLNNDYALVVGSNTKGLEKIDNSLIADRALNDLIASIGEGASLTGGAASAANAIQHMSGLYKLDAVTKAQLAAGNALTKTADGQLIGTVRNASGQISRQARLIPVSAPQIAGAIAAIGPAVAMVAVQMQLNNISKQVSTVQQTSLQTLQVLTDSRNADYQGDCQTINEVYQASSNHGCVSETDWSIISGLVSRIQSHRHFYKKQVANHQEALEKAHADSHTQRDYIQTNRARIVNDSCAAFETLRAWAQLTELRIARAQAQGEHPHAEPLQIRQEVIEDLQVQRALLHGLMRELRIIAELPGGWTVPASSKRKQAHLSQQMAQEIIGTLNPRKSYSQPGCHLCTRRLRCVSIHQDPALVSGRGRRTQGARIPRRHLDSHTCCPSHRQIQIQANRGLCMGESAEKGRHNAMEPGVGWTCRASRSSHVARNDRRHRPPYHHRRPTGVHSEGHCHRRVLHQRRDSNVHGGRRGRRTPGTAHHARREKMPRVALPERGALRGAQHRRNAR